jgi:3-oxoacyl-[acyl-carrier protein] reductase
MTNQTNRVAIITGASGGIGAAVAERLANDGFTVVVNYAGNAASAAAVVARIEAAGGRAVTAQADISDVAAVARMFESTETAFGGVDVLINNAGIMNLATIADSSDALFDRHIAVNLKGTSIPCAKRRAACVTAAGSSTFPRASPACCSRLTASMPPPRRRSRP